MPDSPADPLASWATRHHVSPAALDELRALLAPTPLSAAPLFTVTPEIEEGSSIPLAVSPGEHLGAGGMGEVVRAFDPTLGRDVALKALHPRHAHSAQHRAWFEEEARAQAQLAHPGVLAVHQMGRLPDGRPCFTMEINRGRTLHELIVQRHQGADGPTVRRLVDVVRRVGEVIAYAHGRGVVHRDLKPANVMVGAFGETHVIDWGLVLREGTRDSSGAGTPAYMAPEQRTGSAIGPPADIYALGAILHEVATGRRLADAPDAVLPDGLPELVAAATHPEPQSRPAASEWTRQLSDWIDGAARRVRAQDVLVRAEALEPRAAALREQAEMEEATFRALVAEVAPHAPVEAKAAQWAAQDEAERCRRAATRAERERIDLLVQALSHDPDLPEAKAHLARWHRSQLEQAEARRDLGAAEAAEARLRHYDQGEHAAYLSGTGAVSLVTDPPGARVRLHRWELVDRHRVAQFVRDLGPTPLVELPLARGSWLLTVHCEGHRDVAYPVRIGRGEHWHGRPPGAADPLPIWLPPTGALGSDDCYVPAGWFTFGDGDVAHQAWPMQPRWVGGLVMRRFAVTNAEYIGFLDALVAAGHEDLAHQYVPRAQRAQDDDRIEPVYARRADGTHALVPDGDGDLWLPDWPVVQIDWVAAGAYAAWEADRTGAPWRLPVEPEWEKAARGVDGRRYPWGDKWDATFALVRNSLPDRATLRPVTEFPIDESVYGVRGMAGGVRDWCAPRYARPGAPLPPHSEPGERLVRGGCWHFSGTSAQLTTRQRLFERRVSDLAGMRLCRSIEGET